MLTYSVLIVIVIALSCHISAIPQSSDHNFDCVSMRPESQVGVLDTFERKPCPFEIIVKEDKYDKDNKISVVLKTKRSQRFRSFFLQARRIDENSDRDEPIGHWKISDSTLAKRVCEDGKAVVSAHEEPRETVELEWIAPSQSAGHIQFLATFMSENGKFWLKEESKPLRDVRASGTPFKPRRKPSPPIEPVHTDVCGTEKGCYRVPVGCWEENCDYLMTWVDRGDEVEFEISVSHDGFDNRWAAIGLSHDTYMGEDSVMECVQDAQTGKVEVFMSRVPKGAKYTERLPDPKYSLLHEEGSYYHGKLRCRFRCSKYFATTISKSLTSDGFHILMARGIAHAAEILRHSILVSDYPVASPEKVTLQKHHNIGGRASYPLIKAHMCIMLFAWIFCGTIGLLMVKYYKPMWPNSDFYGEKYWFTVHRSCLVTLVIAVVIAFIIIFVELDGYSQHPDLPGRAHPILGIIVTICVVINPILALLRPSEGHRCRPVFNWFHFFFGIIANVLAVVNIFIGMGFGKPAVPWWATWIVMLYFLFNLIIEVMLEVHMCWTHKKNKERMKKWELEKKEYPKLYHPKPHPVGHVFKRNVLFTHVIVTTIVTIILVITFAVC